MLKEKYDIVVVGAGLGGITAGALLAKKGLDVLVVEQHYLPGGVCSSIKRNGAALDVGAALMFGWSGDDASPHRFVMNTLEEDIDMIQHEATYRMHFGDKSVTFWRDFEKYFKELTAAFPGKEEQFRGFYEHCFEVYRIMGLSPQPMSPDTTPLSATLKMLMKYPKEMMQMPTLMDSSMKEVLDQYVQDPFVEGFFDLLIASCYCTTIEETPLMLAAAVAASTHVDGASYPKGSPQMLPNKIEKSLEKYGGQILYRYLVDEIIIKNGKACGVRLENGIEIKADRIISNASIWQLYNKLIKPEHIKPKRLEWANSFQPTYSACVVYMTVKAEAIPEGTHHIEAFIGDVRNLKDNNYFVYIPSIDDPSVAPEGMHTVSVLCSAGDYKWPRPNDPEYRSETYQQWKDEIAEGALKVIDKHFPNFRKNILTMEVASPTTIERFTLKDWGNIGGAKQMLGQHLLNRLGARSEFKNLYCVGDSTTMGEGIVSVTASAVGATNMILKDMRKKQYSPRKFDKDYVHFVKGEPLTPFPSKDEPLTEEGAKRLAFECQWCEDQKCVEKCPANIDVLNFVRRIEVGNYIGAAQVMRETNPLAEICGVACPAENFCESECKHLEFSDEPVSIKRLQEWVSKQAGADGWVKHEAKKNGMKVAVIGAGPAGLSCAYYLARLNYSVDIFEKDTQAGGIPAQAIPNFRLTKEVMNREVDEILKHPNITVHYNKEFGKDIELHSLKEKYQGIFLGIGLDTGRILNIEGIDKTEYYDALSFLKSFNDKSLTKLEGDILIVGGGSVATDAAMVAKKLGADNVTLLCLETEEEMPCLKSELHELKEEGIKIVNSWGPNKISEKSKIECVKCTSVFDGDGNFCPEFNTEEAMEIKFDKLILAVGQKINDNLGKYLETLFGQVEINTTSHLIEGQEIVFAGGDLTRGAGTIVEAVTDGRKAAMAIHKKINGK